jgi:hypothetical protein
VGFEGQTFWGTVFKKKNKKLQIRNPYECGHLNEKRNDN